MEFRELGKTGKKVSEIGLGCEFLDFKPYAQVEETIETALEYGVNIFDVFMPGREVRENIARVFGNRRDKVMIQGHIGATDVNKQYDISRDMPSVQRYFEDLLRIFGGYIDFGMMFFIDSENDYSGVFETEFADYAQKLKAQGKIGHIGFSSHNPAMAARVINTGLPELMLFSINPAFDMTPYDIEAIEKGYEQGLHTGIDPKRAQLYKLCAQKGIGITVMKSLGAGKLLSAEHTPFAKPMSVPQCLHYALSRPAVASVLPGCQTAGQVHEAMRYYSVGGSGRDYTEIISSVRGDFRGSCVYCSHCQPCPAGIDIAAVTKYLDIARLDTA
ncbi:MAG: aldo/keto reductase, partial [Oscillospiraceae bacterium]|nr:aldo/keto reductase [Oscillospiraceae bacterium]